MALFPSFDNRTLLSCQLLLAIAFSVAFFGIRRAHADMRGVGSIAYGFLIGVPGVILLLTQGILNPLLSVIAANFLIAISLICFCNGIYNLIQSKRSILPLWISSLLSISLVAYFTLVHDNIAARVIVISLNVGLIRAFMAIELFRMAAGRTIMRLFAFSTTFFALLTFGWVVIAIIHGAPKDLMRQDHVQSFILALAIFSSCLTGLFSLTLCHDQALTLVRAESQFDLLAGTLNRRGIEHKLEIELRRNERANHPLSVALIDIDFFKAINDTAGHAAGDIALRQVASSISAQLRAYDLLGRFGGDEFLLILPHTPATGAKVVAERIGAAVRSFSGTTDGPAITLSIGLSEAVAGDYSTSLLARADKALYQAKRQGRNCTRTVLIDAEVEETSSQPLIEILMSATEPTLIRS
jgi:diguanylate cyclase (GGDEF)-like protein